MPDTQSSNPQRQANQEAMGQVLWQLSLVLNTAQYYRTPAGIEHPMIETKVREWFDHLTKCLEKEKQISIEETKGMLAVNKVVFPPKSIVLQKLLQKLLKFKIGNIKLTRGLSYAEIQSLILFLTIALEQSDTLDQARAKFAALKLAHIQIEYAEYRKVSEMERITRKSARDQTGQISLDKANIDLMIDFLHNFKRDKSTVPGAWVDSIIADPQKLSQLMLLIADNEDSKREIQLSGDWTEVMTYFIWAIRNYLLQQKDKEVTSHGKLKYLETVEQVINEKITEKQLVPEQSTTLRKHFATVRQEVTLEVLLLDWVKQQQKTDSLAHKIIAVLKELEAEPEQLSAMLEKVRKVSRRGDQLEEYLQEL